MGRVCSAVGDGFITFVVAALVARSFFGCVIGTGDVLNMVGGELECVKILYLCIR